MFLPIYIALLIWGHLDHPDWAVEFPENNIHTQAMVSPPIQGILPLPTPWPGQGTFLSIYTGPNVTEHEVTVQIGCKTEHALNNVESHIVIEGVLQEDVVSSSGNILIAAGSKVVGNGYCDPDTGRIRARGRWTFFASDHQISSSGVVFDAGGIEGIKGEEVETGMSEAKIKQAIYRDGIYLYVPSGTSFTLRLSGHISVQDLGSSRER
jgi:hypothetical protein